MTNSEKLLHWEQIYQTKQLNEVSWYQPVPETSLQFIDEANLPPEAKIIDIGGGDSFLADHLLAKGFTNISVLDISANALQRANDRLGSGAEKAKWIQSDVISYEPYEQYDLWHDRAAFHFITDNAEIDQYVRVVEKSLKTGGQLVIGTFSETGPQKCSGLAIKQYSTALLAEVFKGSFELIKSISVDHPTPFDTTQNFVFCSFRKL